MRTRRAFRPVVDSMPSLLLPSSILPTNPNTPVLIPGTPPPAPSPTSPTLITSPQPYNPPYVGPDAPTPIDPAPALNV